MHEKTSIMQTKGVNLDIELVLPILEDSSISYLMRSENYRNVEHIFTNNILVSDTKMQALLEIFLIDLRNDMRHAVAILKILNMLFKKIKDGESPIYPELEDVGSAILNILTVTGPLHKVQLLQANCLDALLLYPESELVKFGTFRSDELLKVVDQYLGNANIEIQIKKLFLSMLLKVIKLLPLDKRQDFVKNGMTLWFNRIVPLLFLYSSTRLEAVEIVERILPELTSIDYTEDAHWLSVYKNICEPDKYPKLLMTLLQTSDELWWRLWCVIVRLLGTQLHRSKGPINHLLFVLENAFKMDPASRCKAFTCWKALIENFALNINELFIPKRIKLLAIPLKVNNAKIEEIAVAKFEVWWYLLKLMQQKLDVNAKIILVPFLQFCFGSSHSVAASGHITPGLAFPKVQKLAIQGLTELFGHNADCSQCTVTSFDKLSKGVVNKKLFCEYLSDWLHSMKECMLLVYKILCEEPDCLHVPHNMACLWKAFLRLSTSLDDKAQTFEIWKQLFQMLSVLTNECPQNSTVVGFMLKLFLPSLVNSKTGFPVAVLNDSSYMEISDLTPTKYLLRLSISPAVSHLFRNDTQDGTGFLRRLMEVGLATHRPAFVRWLLQELLYDHCSLVCWTLLADTLTNHTDLDVLTVKDVLIWPITKSEKISNIKYVFPVWRKLYAFVKSSGTAQNIDTDIANILSVHLKNSPSTQLMAMCVLPTVINIAVEASPGSVKVLDMEIHTLCDILGKQVNMEHCEEVMDASRCLTAVLRISTDHHPAMLEELITGANRALITCVMCSKENAKLEELEEVICDMLSTLLYCLAKPEYAKFKLLLTDSLLQCVAVEVMPEVSKIACSINSCFLSKSPKANMEANLKSVSNTPTEAEMTALKSVKEADLSTTICDPKINGDIRPMQIVSAKVNVSTSTTPTKSEKAKIKSKTPNTLSDPKSSPVNSRPRLTKTPKSTNRTPKTVVEGGEEFLVVESKWKFNPKKLTDHQKEVFKRKREDIPALYEDLTQSQDSSVIKPWQPPGYRSDTNETQSKSNTDDQSPSAVIKIDNLLKDVCPNFVNCLNTSKTGSFTTKESSPIREKKRTDPDAPIVDVKCDEKISAPASEYTIKNVRQNTPVSDKSIKITPNGKTRISLKDKITQNVKNLISRPNGDLLPKEVETTVVSIKPQAPLTPMQNLKPNTLVSSAPANLDPDRPSRVKRKPKKFYPDDDELYPNKRRISLNICDPISTTNKGPKEKSSSDDDTHQASTSSSASTSDSRKCQDKVPNVGSANKKKRSSRLERELAIDTVEGHPLIHLRENKRSRKSRMIDDIKVQSSETIATDENNFGIEKSLLLINSGEEDINKTEIEDNTNKNITADEIKESDHNKENILENFEDPQLIETQIDHTETLQLNTFSKDNVEHSEDFIESSQESSVSTLSIKTRRSNRYTSENITPKSTRKSLQISAESAAKVSTQIAKEQESDFQNVKLGDLCHTQTEPIQSTQLDAVETCMEVDNSLTTQEIAEADTQVATTQDILETQSLLEKDRSPNQEFMNINTYKEEPCPVNTMDIDEHHKSESLSKSTLNINNTADSSTCHIVDLTDEGYDNVSAVQGNDSVAKDVSISTELPCDTASMDTQTAPDTLEDIQSEKLGLSRNSIVSSPHEFEHNRNKDFINNTLDISPIKNMSPQKVELGDKISLKDVRDDDIIIQISPPRDREHFISESPEFFTNDQDKISPEKQQHMSPPREALPTATSSPSSSLSLKKNRPQVRQTGRAAQMLGLCLSDAKASARDLAVPLPMSIEKSGDTDEHKRTPNNVNPVPVKRNLKVAYCNIEVEEASEVQQGFEDVVSGETFLVFSKPLPTPDASPAVPILKRKLAEMMDDSTLSPASKRKRVSFHDPPVSMTTSISKYIEAGAVRSPQHRDKNKEHKLHRPLVAKCLANKLEMEYQLENDVTNSIQSATNESDSTNLSLESLQSLDIVKHSQLNNCDPIFPELINCTDPITNIAGDLASILWKDMLLKELKDKVDTIGDLAKLTELDVNRLCIRAPKVETARKALSAYRAKISAAKEVFEAKICCKDVQVSCVPSMNANESQTDDMPKISADDIIKDYLCTDIVESYHRSEMKQEFVAQISSCKETSKTIAENLPTCDLTQILLTKICSEGEASVSSILRDLSKAHPQQFLEQTIRNHSPQDICRKLSDESIGDYLLQKLTSGQLVRFCSELMQKKVPFDSIL